MWYTLLSHLNRWSLSKLNQKHQDFPAMVVPTRDFVGSEIQSFGQYERRELASLLNGLDFECRAYSCLDVGAHIGNHCLAFAQHFGHVHAFEPETSNFELLQINTRDQKNVTCHPYGISNTNFTHTMERPPGNSGGSRLAPEAAMPASSATFRPLERISEQVVALIKIDVEGHEQQALEGMRECIEKDLPILVLEHNNRDGRGGSSLQLIRDLGYNRLFVPSEPLLPGWGRPSFTRVLLSRLLFPYRPKLKPLARVDQVNYPMIICTHPGSVFQLDQDT